MAEPSPHDESIDLMAQYILWQLVDIERVQWEDYPELGQYDFERILERVEEIMPKCPDLHDRRDAYEHLSHLADVETDE
jgi:hypothetical protein